MSGDTRLIHVTPAQRVEGDPTPGMTREVAFTSDAMWAGLTRTAAGMTSGWHHHGDHETTIFVVAGRLRMESGPGGRNVIEALPGDFIYVPRRAVHRESNPSEEEGQLVIVRAGDGPTTFNLDAPPQE